MMKQLASLIRMLKIESCFTGYFHQLVFPSTTLATTAGLTYSIQTFRPVSADLTEFSSYVFTARHDGTASHRTILAEAGKPAIDFNRAVFEEDRVICEQAQRGLRQASSFSVGELSREERRVAGFQEAWAERIGRRQAS